MREGALRPDIFKAWKDNGGGGAPSKRARGCVSRAADGCEMSRESPLHIETSLAATAAVKYTAGSGAAEYL